MMYGRLTVNPIHAAWNTVARFDDYGSAQRAVDRLSDDGFPVEQLDIVGSDLQLVERVTGRLTKWRAAAAGALSGMWAGLLIGILFGLFTTGHAWLAVVAAGIGLGVLWGAIPACIGVSLLAGRVPALAGLATPDPVHPEPGDEPKVLVR